MTGLALAFPSAESPCKLEIKLRVLAETNGSQNPRMDRIEKGELLREFHVSTEAVALSLKNLSLLDRLGEPF